SNAAAKIRIIPYFYERASSRHSVKKRAPPGFPDEARRFDGQVQRLGRAAAIGIGGLRVELIDYPAEQLSLLGIERRGCGSAVLSIGLVDAAHILCTCCRVLLWRHPFARSRRQQVEGRFLPPQGF